jgi:Leucine-rich repeat (LRR) protein
MGGALSSAEDSSKKKRIEDITISHFELSRKEVAAAIERLASTHLLSVSISSSKLKEIPETVSKLGSLTSARLDHNRLSSLPESLAAITR